MEIPEASVRQYIAAMEVDFASRGWPTDADTMLRALVRHVIQVAWENEDRKAEVVAFKPRLVVDNSGNSAA